MKILFLTSAHNSLSQRLLIELTERGHCVHVTTATSDDTMFKAVREGAPELIVAPMLKVAIPESICSKYVCMIVHPGVIGDRGASALDWAQSVNTEARSCWIAGFSFGAWIGMQLLMRRPEIEGFISIAPPANLYDFSFLAPCPSSGLIIHGDAAFANCVVNIGANIRF